MLRIHLQTLLKSSVTNQWQRWKPLLREENHKGVRLLLRAIAIAFALFTTVVFSVIAKLLDTSKAVGFH